MTRLMCRNWREGNLEEAARLERMLGEYESISDKEFAERYLQDIDGI